MPKVRICYTDTATGAESIPADMELAELSAQALADAWLAYCKAEAQQAGERLEATYKVECKALVQQGSTYAFILAITGVVYFREYLIHGALYTNFR